MSREENVLRPEVAVEPGRVSYEAGHVLYVEGKEGSVDTAVLQALLEDETSIKVEGLGPCYSISNVAEALFQNHPHYYFLIDRDAHDDQMVDSLWANFPDPAKKNLLVWRRKEIENYFIDPQFVSEFQEAYADFPDFKMISMDEYVERLQQEASKRVYYEAANRVIQQVRYRLQNENRFTNFTGTQGLETKESALKKLQQYLDLDNKAQKDREIFEAIDIENSFSYELELLLGGAATCELGRGRWMELMGGKKLLNILLSSSFRVFDRDDNEITDNRKILHIVTRAMTKLPDPHLPEDFRQLKALILKRIV